MSALKIIGLVWLGLNMLGLLAAAVLYFLVILPDVKRMENTEKEQH